MPLSTPLVAREPQHTRTVTCRGYRREDGLWDIEGQLVDVKTVPLPRHDQDDLLPGEPIHGLWLRLTVDLDLNIKAVEVAMDHIPNPVCGEVKIRFQSLVGLQIAPGFTRQVRERLGGRKGCTHLVEMVGIVATTAFQSLFLEREARASKQPVRERPHIIDTCHTLRSNGPVIERRWPEYYTGPEPGDPPPD